jgi:DNA invertase Pin-like site-specific DNA recombinase
LDANQRKFDIVMAWSVDRPGRSLRDLVGFLSELHALHRPVSAPTGLGHDDASRHDG